MDSRELRKVLGGVLRSLPENGDGDADGLEDLPMGGRRGDPSTAVGVGSLVLWGE